jgi:uncharacterized protein (TIGR02118 family)
MIKLVFCLRRQPHLSREAFQTYWRETHAPLVRERAKAIGALRYVQVHTTHDDLNALLRASRGGPEPFDGVAELWFEDRASLEAALGTDAGRTAGAELLADERKFIDLERSPLWIGEEHPIVGDA